MSRFVVIETIFHRRYVAKEVVGETKAFWEMRNVRTDEVRNHKKSSTRFYAESHDQANAERIAENLTAEIGAEVERHRKAMGSIMRAFRLGSQREVAPLAARLPQQANIALTEQNTGADNG